MIERDIVVVGAGPAGLAASMDAAKAGADVLLVDLNMKPGGQMLENKLVRADEKIRKQLNLEPGAYVIYIPGCGQPMVNR